MTKAAKWEVRRLLNGEGYVVVDTTAAEPMRGTWSRRSDAQRRCDELNGKDREGAAHGETHHHPR